MTDDGDQQQVRATDAMMAISRTMTAIVARTLDEVSSQMTVPQLRVLVLLSSRGPMNLSTVARHLDVNPSNASRTCDQLVTSGRVSRTPDPHDRRSTVLRLTEDGTRFVAGLMAARRRSIEAVTSRMLPEDQRVLAEGLEAFLSAAAAVPAEESIGLPDGRTATWLP